MIILPSLEIVPAKYNGNILLSQIPVNGAGDFTVSRALNTATRINSLGNIEAVNADTPRLDYFASGGTVGCPALLVEPSGSNLALQSENFGTTWNPANMLAFGSGSVLNTTATLDPYGTNVADFIVGNTTVGQHRFDQTTTSVSGSYTLSVFVKAGGYSFTRLRIGLAGAVFDLSSGVVVTTDAGITSSIQSFRNGWFRCIIGKAASAANEIIRINMQPTSSTADFAGDGTSGIYVFGAQYETGSIATSYIPTTTAAVTRNADVISVSGAVSGSIGQTEGTMYAEFFVDFNNRDADIFSVDGGSTSDGFFMSIRNSSVVQLIVRTASANALIFQRTGTYPTGVNKLAVAYKNGDFAICLNGTTVQTNTSSITMPSVSINRASLGRTSLYNLNQQLRIRAAALYTTRLTNTQLALLTSPYTSYSSMASALSYTLG